MEMLKLSELLELMAHLASKLNQASLCEYLHIDVWRLPRIVLHPLVLWTSPLFLGIQVDFGLDTAYDDVRAARWYNTFGADIYNTCPTVLVLHW